MAGLGYNGNIHRGKVRHTAGSIISSDINHLRRQLAVGDRAGITGRSLIRKRQPCRCDIGFVLLELGEQVLQVRGCFDRQAYTHFRCQQTG